MRDAQGSTPRRVSVTRTGDDVFMVSIGETTVALGYLELVAVATETAEAAGLRATEVDAR